MEIYTIGSSGKAAEAFFGCLRKAGIKRLLDVRLNNTSQLAGFTKRNDLAFFLKELCSAEYVHEPLLAPTQEILDTYKKRAGTWQEYEERFLALMAERKVEEVIERGQFEVPTVLLCSESSPNRCHRRLVAEYVKSKWGGLDIIHL